MRRRTKLSQMTDVMSVVPLDTTILVSPTLTVGCEHWMNVYLPIFINKQYSFLGFKGPLLATCSILYTSLL